MKDDLLTKAIVARTLARQAAKELRSVGSMIDADAPKQSSGKMLVALGETIDCELTLIGQIMIDEAQEG